ncbi:MAG: DUF998 domain-containing protein [Chloroflexota bacterium]|nr:DUF998 domain-containing protein [Chloroflexota bacterium]
MQGSSTNRTSKTSETPSRNLDVSRRISSTGARQQGASRAKLLAAAGLVGSAVGTAALTASHVVRPDVNDTSTISAYAVGPHGWLMTTAFLFLGLGALALAIGLHRAMTPSRWLLVGTVLVGVFGIGFILAGVFPVGGCENVQCVARFESGADVSMSAAAIAHGAGALLGLLLLIVGMLVLSRAFKHDPRWRSLWPWSLVLGLAALIQFFLAGEGIVGAILMRTLVLTLVLWMVLAAIRLRSSARSRVA